jgi:hypothetical protein
MIGLAANSGAAVPVLAAIAVFGPRTANAVIGPVAIPRRAEDQFPRLGDFALLERGKMLHSHENRLS